MTTRREFLGTSAAASVGLLAGAGTVFNASAAFGDVPARAPMNILIFGGTGYIGPHLVRAAVSRGHKVTIFSRGRKDGDLPTGVERLVGDRLINDTIPKGDLKSLEGRRFDAVIDDPASDPRWVRQSADLLKTSGSYLFVSSTGVFYPYKTPNADENTPTTPEAAAKPDPATGRADGSATYGYQKSQCEQIVMEVFREHGAVVRPSYIIGPGDVSDRFTYWPQRLARGGETLAPGKKTDPIAIVDVRDLTAFMIKLVEDKRGGIYNVTGPEKAMGFGEFIDIASKAIKSTSKFVWVDDDEFLTKNRISYTIPWVKQEGNNMYHTSLNNSKAVKAGLKFHPLADTVRDVLAWWPERLKLLPAGQQPRFWITPEREQEVLAAWKARSG